MEGASDRRVRPRSAALRQKSVRVLWKGLPIDGGGRGRPRFDRRAFVYAPKELLFDSYSYQGLIEIE